jgi:hypothetical protein
MSCLNRLRVFDVMKRWWPITDKDETSHMGLAAVGTTRVDPLEDSQRLIQSHHNTLAPAEYRASSSKCCSLAHTEGREQTWRPKSSRSATWPPPTRHGQGQYPPTTTFDHCNRKHLNLKPRGKGVTMDQSQSIYLKASLTPTSKPSTTKHLVSPSAA